MKRYVIERHIPGVGSLPQENLKALAAASNAAIEKLPGKVQWIQSHLAADQTFCIYLAETEERVREHSRLAGFPITRVHEIARIIDPMTAYA